MGRRRYLSLERLTHVGIGHVKYSTKGGNKIENVQPLNVVCNKGHLSIAQNGTITNAEELKKGLVDIGAIIQSSTDTELVLHMLSRTKKATFIETLKDVLDKIEGALTFVMLHDNELIATRDPHGFMPLWVGKKKDGTVVVASETCALDVMQVTDYREVKPGEIIIVDENGMRSDFIKPRKQSQCVFELVYFARPDSYVFGESVYEMRKRMGMALAEDDNVKGDVVMSVPDSGNYAAIGYALKSGLPFEYGLSRNHYVGRSFIMPTQTERELVVRMKLNPIKSVVEGKRIILVDDSLVRGTTSKIIVKMLREAGAREIHLRLSSPEVKSPCYFGIDITSKDELISNRMTPQEIAKYIGADTVKFLPVDKLRKCVNDKDNFCCGCFDGKYSVKVE